MVQFNSDYQRRYWILLSLNNDNNYYDINNLLLLYKIDSALYNLRKKGNRVH